VVGVPANLEELFRAEYVRLVRALAAASGGSDAAADAVQDAFVAAARHWRRVSRYDEPAAWLRRVAVNRVRDQARARRRRDRALHRLVVPFAHEDPPASDDALLAALTALPTQQRVAVEHPAPVRIGGPVSNGTAAPPDQAYEPTDGSRAYATQYSDLVSVKR
jgi:DNA-directed RNA polymerase specialized sigma24 family protein